MEQTRLYSRGDLVDALTEQTLALWFKELGAGRTYRSFCERALEELEIQWRDTQKGVIWCTIAVVGKRSHYSWHDVYRVLAHSEGTYYLDPRHLT